ncbi:MAG: FG-GAP-like repeat-containing protein [Acidobacteriota bacterium]|nr:FG-GAP-like repeat-containing protein [Acidobacteriota bacterium]
MALIPGGVMFPNKFLSLDVFPGKAQGEPLQAENVEFHLHPHYREKLPLDATLLKTQAGLDEFVTEKYNDQIENILSSWSAALLLSPQDIRAIENVLASGFLGTSFRSVQSRVVRTGPVVEVHENRSSSQNSLEPDDFLQELRSFMESFSNIAIADFQIVSIDATDIRTPGQNAAPSGSLKTRIRYELVGEGKSRAHQPKGSGGFSREQRVGHWQLEWQTVVTPTSKTEFRIRTWQLSSETWSRSEGLVYVDIASQALGANASFSSQMLLGTDYWRTVLDGACGIDIYGHNGISVGDIDGDGFDDLYVCQPAGLPNRLYRNRGDGTFEDVTETAGVGILENTACALFADYDNDGRQDLIVVRTDGPVLFHNEGNGKFRKIEYAFKFATPPQGTFTGAAVADYDRDGWLDIYFCLYLYYQGTEQYKYPSPYYDAENGPPNFLMRNNRDGTFCDVTAEAGLDKNNASYSFCCGWGDYNGNGWPDLYVVNDFGKKNLYRNNGDRTFTDITAKVGVEDVGAGMSVCSFDYDNDGAEDLYVANMWTAAGNRIATQEIFQKEAPQNVRALYRKHAMGNSLFCNNSDGTFGETTAKSEVGMGRWSWSSDAWDFDHDGFADIYVTNGMISGPSRSRQDLNGFFWRQVVANSAVDARPSQDYEQGWNAINELIRSDGNWSGFERNVFYANNRDGTFSDVSGVIGLDFIEDGRAFALSDFDHDGRLEVFLKNRNSPQLRLAKNVMKELPPSMTIRLSGRGRSNRDAIGAVVTVRTEQGQQTRWLQAGSGFLSQHSKELFFGLGDARAPVHASIRWPSGTVQEIRDLPVNCRIWVEEGSEKIRTEAFRAQKSESKGAHDPQGLKPSSGVSSGDTAEAVPFPKTNKRIISLPTEVETWLIAPLPAPAFDLPDLNGHSHTISGLRGKQALLHFWTTESGSYEKDLKALDELYKTQATGGLHVLSLNADSDEEVLRAVAQNAEISVPILRAADDVGAIYNLVFRQLFDRHRDMPLPCSFLLNKKSEIVKVYQGVIKAENIHRDAARIPENALERLTKALPFPGVSDVPEFRRNYLSFGSVFFQRGYFEQAGVSFELALRDDPSSAEALYGLGSVYLKQEKQTQARETFLRATEARASFPETLPNSWNNLGLLATREQRFDEAIQYFQEALRLSPTALIALNNLGNAFRQQKQWDKARTVLERAIAVNAKDPEANYSLGMVFAQLNETEEAYKYLQAALQFRPDYPEALNNLGVLNLRTGERDKAIAKFEECIRVAPAFDQAYLNLAKLYALESEPDKARALLQALLKQHPGQAAAQAMLTQLEK